MDDTMVAKLVAWDVDREQATARMLRGLGEYEIGKRKTLVPFHQTLLQTGQWHGAETRRDLSEDRAWIKELAFPKPESTAGEAEAGAETPHRSCSVQASGTRFDVKVIGAPLAAGAIKSAGPTGGARPDAGAMRRAQRGGCSGGRRGGDSVSLPLQGTVLKVTAEQRGEVEDDALVAVIEAMNMENEITALKAGDVSKLPIAVSASVAGGDTLARITTAT